VSTTQPKTIRLLGVQLFPLVPVREQDARARPLPQQVLGPALRGEVDEDLVQLGRDVHDLARQAPRRSGTSCI
jgi:hypothetical protein